MKCFKYSGMGSTFLNLELLNKSVSSALLTVLKVVDCFPLLLYHVMYINKRIYI